jgi:hypothetical protein
VQELILLTLKHRDERMLVVTFGPAARAALFAWTPMQAELLVGHL